MTIATFADRMQGFLRYARTHNERGNRQAVDEALEDALRLVDQLGRQHAERARQLRTPRGRQ
jgi:hypothetical protein